MSYLRTLWILPALLILAACASKFEAEVSRFHRLEQPRGETIKIVPMEEKNLGSLEFQSYADLVRGNLETTGFRVVPATQEADLVARLDYGVNDGTLRIRSYSSYGYGGFGRFHHGYWGHYYHPYPYYGDNEIRSYVVFMRWMELEIVRAGAAPDDPDWMVYEGMVRSEGRNPHLNEVAPLLVEALFANFPGESGETTDISIKLGDSRGVSY